MRFDELNENNFLLFAVKNYENPHAVTKDDFYEDLKRFRWIKRLLRRYKKEGDLNHTSLLIISSFYIMSLVMPQLLCYFTKLIKSSGLY